MEEKSIKSHPKLPAKKLPGAIISNILDAMLHSSSKARDRFPRLLELIAMYPDNAELFVEKAKRVPSWMFIRWLAQMMALLDKPEGPAVISILTEIAKSYPHAVYYPFKISTEDLGPKAQKLIEPLSQILDKPLLRQFVSSLEKLTHPEHRFKDWLEVLKPLMKNNKRSIEEVEKIKEVWPQIYDDVFNPNKPELGTYNKKFAANWEKEVCTHFGKDGSKLFKMANETFLGFVGDMWDKMSKGMKKETCKMKLTEFSQTLADFEQSDQLTSEYIELPGQYSGLSKPLPETHIKVSSYDPDLLVMGSLRKPKRLKIHGNDEKDHPFLVKGGEDLRLDQRIQQLFSVMNEILQADPACSKRRLKLKTYQVIPMTTKVGIIEWIENTKPLKEIIEEEIANIEGKKKGDVHILKIPAAALHSAWINSYANKVSGKRRNQCDLYYAMYQHASRVEATKQVKSMQNTIPGDLLRRGIVALSSSPEAFLSLRAHFARTLAVFSVSSYIIGIGDRHLENFLLNFIDGGLVGIDFGHAFGTATQFLPIPELIPFRLTRQLTDFLQPLDTDGLLKHNMVHTLRALQESKEVLLNTMDVFIKEPLIDWEKLARRLARDQGGEEEKSTWFPKEKIQIVKRKLNGDNPSHITIAELKESVHKTQPYIKSLASIVLGDQAFNVRAKVKERCSSTKEQVDCLVDQATDPNILARTYSGWAPWI